MWGLLSSVLRKGAKPSARPHFVSVASRALCPPLHKGTFEEHSAQDHVAEGLSCFPFYLLESIPVFSFQLLYSHKT